MRAITAALAGIAALAAVGIHGAGAEATKPRHAIAMQWFRMNHQTLRARWRTPPGR